MTEYDQENLDFIYSLDEETRADWWSSISEDDKDYASELLAEHAKLVNAHILMTMDEVPESMIESNLVLSNLMSKGK